jgi:predicted TIM-barrel fold metal-dependent hydrolase
MRILLIDHGCCDHPHTRIHRFRKELEAEGFAVAVCGPSSRHRLDEQPAGMFGIHLHDVAAGSRAFIAAVQAGSPDAFLAAVATVPSRLLGLAREAARQTIAEAVDSLSPDVIFVLHAGILTDLAVETGAPVVVHVSPNDLLAAEQRASLRRLVSAAIGSATGIVAADPHVAERLCDTWTAGDADTLTRFETWSADAVDAPRRVAAICRAALTRRRGV